MKDKTKNATESISVRVDAELKRKLFEKLEKQDKCFSKWLRNVMRKEIDKK